jgi:hypothetical protein
MLLDIDNKKIISFLRHRIFLQRNSFIDKSGIRVAKTKNNLKKSLTKISIPGSYRIEKTFV